MIPEQGGIVFIFSFSISLYLSKLLSLQGAASSVLTATGSRTATAGSVTASLLSGWSIEVNAGLALLL